RIGGLGTLIGTPPLSILAATVGQLYDTELTFGGWMAFGVPLVIILIPVLWLYLTKVMYKVNFKALPGGKDSILEHRKAPEHMTYEEKAVLAVFVFAAFMWITRTFIWQNILNIPGIVMG